MLEDTGRMNSTIPQSVKKERVDVMIIIDPTESQNIVNFTRVRNKVKKKVLWIKSNNINQLQKKNFCFQVLWKGYMNNSFYQGG